MAQYAGWTKMYMLKTKAVVAVVLLGGAVFLLLHYHGTETTEERYPTSVLIMTEASKTDTQVAMQANTKQRRLDRATSTVPVIVATLKEPTFAVSKSLNLECNDSVCSEYLTPRELVVFNRCNKRIEGFQANVGPCHFLNITGRQPIALASFPGSGNTWVRGLLEKTTGICTGTALCTV